VKEERKGNKHTERTNERNSRIERKREEKVDGPSEAGRETETTVGGSRERERGREREREREADYSTLSSGFTSTSTLFLA